MNDLDAMTGRELDAIVAVEVMAWMEFPYLMGGIGEVAYSYPGGTHVMDIRPLPAYSSDPAACAEVERELWRMGAALESRYVPRSRRDGIAGRAVAVVDGDNESEGRADISDGSDPIAARCLATCRAAVRFARAGKAST